MTDNLNILCLIIVSAALIAVLLALLFAFKFPSKSTVTLHISRRGTHPLKILVVKNWIQRCCGLLNHQELSNEQALMLWSTQSIHTRGMRFAIDVVWVDAKGKIIAVDSNVPPGKKLQNNLARHVIELSAGTAKNHFEVGEIFSIHQEHLDTNRDQK